MKKDMLQVGYGSMLLESLLAVLVIVIVGSLPNLKQTGVLDSALANMALADTATPFTKFSAGVTGLVAQLGLPQSWGLCIMTMFVSALALTSLDAVARISRMSFQEFFEVEEGETPSQLVSVLTNKYVSTLISLFFGYLLSLGGYVNIWPLFGSANQLLLCNGINLTCCILKGYWKKRFHVICTNGINVHCYYDSFSAGYLCNCNEAICCWWIHDHDRWFTVSCCRIISRSWTYDYFPFNW